MRIGPAIALGLLGLTTIALGRIFGLIEMYVLGTALVTAALLSVVTTRSRIVLIDIERRPTRAEPSAGDDVGIELRIRPLRRSPGFTLRDHIVESDSLPRSRVDISIPPSKRNQETVARYRIRAEHRGVIALGPATVEHGDPFGLARWSRTVGGATEIIVLPRWNTIALPDPRECEGQLVDAIREMARHLASDREFRSLREYAPGDEARSINWRATARRDLLIVSEYESRTDIVLDVRLDVDTSTYSPEGFERAASIAASFVGSASLRDDDGVKVRLSCAGPGADRQFDAVIDESTRADAMRFLSLVTPQVQPAQVRHHPARSMISIPVVICGHRQSEWLESTCQSMGGSSVGVVISCEGAASLVPPRRWFFVDGSDFDSFESRWSILSRHLQRR